MKVKTNLQLRYSDTDQMGVIHHSMYFQYFELGRLDYLNQINMDYYQFEEKGIMMPLRDVGCKYIQSIKADESCYVETEIDTFTKIQIKFNHRIFNEKGELKCEGFTQIVCVDKDNFKVKKIETVLPELYQKMVGDR